MADPWFLMIQAIVNGWDFPGRVPDTPENRRRFATLKTEIAQMKAEGLTPWIPWDYTDDIE